MTKQDIAASTADANKKRDNKTWQINLKKKTLFAHGSEIVIN